jgi:hypothetical protein
MYAHDDAKPVKNSYLIKRA